MLRRKLLISGLVLAMGCSAAFAKGLRRKPAGEHFGKDLNRLQQQLNLSQTQLDGMRSLQDTRQKELRALRQDLRQQGQSQPKSSDARQKRREINQQFISGVKGLLTPEQVQKLPKRFQ